MDTKLKVYVETTVVSDATALPARDVLSISRQIISREWLEVAPARFTLYSSNVVMREALRGDPNAAQRRVDALKDMQELEADEEALSLAKALIMQGGVPAEYPDDALHIATAALNGMDYLVSWNFKHITNANKIPLIVKICRDKGYVCPCICTPQMLLGEGRE